MPPNADTVRQNARKGHDFEKEVFDSMRSKLKWREVLLSPLDDNGNPMRKENGKPLRTRIDIVSKNQKRLDLFECKSSAKAPLTSNQKQAFPLIESNGCQIESKRKEGLPAGEKHGPTKVQVVRPESDPSKPHAGPGPGPDSTAGGGASGLGPPPRPTRPPNSTAGGAAGNAGESAEHRADAGAPPGIASAPKAEKSSDNPRSFTIKNSKGEHVSQISDRTEAGTEHIYHQAVKDEGDTSTVREYLNESPTDSTYGKSQRYTETQVTKGSPFQTVSKGSAQLDKDHGVIVDDSVVITSKHTELRPEVVAAARDGFVQGATRARQENESRLHLSTESKLHAIKDSLQTAVHEGAASSAMMLIREKIVPSAASRLGEAPRMLPADIRPVCDGERIGATFGGGHSVTLGQRRRSGAEVSRDGARLSSSQVEKGLQFRVGIPQTYGIVGVGGNLGETTNTSQELREDGSSKSTAESLRGFKGGIDVCGVEVLNLDTGKCSSCAEEQEAGIFGRSIETKKSGFKVLGAERVQQSSRHESGMLGDRQVDIDHCAGTASEHKSYGLGKFSILETRTHGIVKTKKANPNLREHKPGTTLTTPSDAGPMWKTPGMSRSNPITSSEHLEVKPRTTNSEVRPPSSTCRMVGHANPITPEHLEFKAGTTLLQVDSKQHVAGKLERCGLGEVRPHQIDDAALQHLEFEPGTSSTQVCLGHGGQLVAGAGAAGAVQGACDLFDGQDATVALKDGAAVFAENLGGVAFMEATGLPILHVGSDHVSAVLPQGLSIGVGHEAGIYETPLGQMHQDTTGVQLSAGIPGDPLQVVQAKAAIGHTVDHFSKSFESAAGTQHHEETCTTDGIELQFTLGNRSTDPVRIGHICTRTNDSSSVVDKRGAKTNTMHQRSYDGVGVGIAEVGRVDEMTSATTAQKDGTTSYSNEEFHGTEEGFATGLYNQSIEQGHFKAESGKNAHSWTDGKGVQRSEASHEAFEGEETHVHSTAFFGLWDLGTRVAREGHVEGAGVSSSSSDVTKNGVRVVSEHTEDTTYQGEQTTVDGTTEEEHLRVHKLLRDHHETTCGNDKQVENVSSTYDGHRDLDKDTADGSSRSGTWHTNKSVHHESLSLYGQMDDVSDVRIQRTQQGDENGPDAQMEDGDICDIAGKHADQLYGVDVCSESYSIHDGEGDMHTNNVLFSTSVHGKMHYDEHREKLVVDNMAGCDVTLSANVNCAIASATGSALQCVINKGYLGWQDCLQISKAGVKQFGLYTLVQAMSDVLSSPWLSVGLVAGLFGAFRDYKALWNKQALCLWDKIVHANGIVSGMAADVALYMLFSTNPYLQVIVAAARFFRDVCREGYDAYKGNLELYMAFRNVYTNPQLGAAGAGLLGAKLGMVVGGCVAGPIGLGLGAAIGGALGGILGAFGLRWMTGAHADRDLQYAYTFLEVGEDSSDAEVYAAYRRKARKFHPDKGGSDEMFKLLGQHYEKIQESRAAKFRSGHAGEQTVKHVAALEGSNVDPDPLITVCL